MKPIILLFIIFSCIYGKYRCINEISKILENNVLMIYNKIFSYILLIIYFIGNLTITCMLLLITYNL